MPDTLRAELKRLLADTGGEQMFWAESESLPNLTTECGIFLDSARGPDIIGSGASESEALADAIETVKGWINAGR